MPVDGDLRVLRRKRDEGHGQQHGGIVPRSLHRPHGAVAQLYQPPGAAPYSAAVYRGQILMGGGILQPQHSRIVAYLRGYGAVLQRLPFRYAQQQRNGQRLAHGGTAAHLQRKRVLPLRGKGGADAQHT